MTTTEKSPANPEAVKAALTTAGVGFASPDPNWILIRHRAGQSGDLDGIPGRDRELRRLRRAEGFFDPPSPLTLPPYQGSRQWPKPPSRPTTCL
jgi:hypothetical protein